MVTTVGRALGVALVGAVAAWSGQAAAQVFAYPNQGQNQAQQSQDHSECHSWAVGQTGFDPGTAPRPAAAPEDSGGFLNFGAGGLFDGGGALGDTATGAGIGAIGGALAGDAAVGAGIGALSGLLFGEINRSSTRSQQASAQNQQSQYNSNLANYRNAYSSCMTPRGYSVQ